MHMRTAFEAGVCIREARQSMGLTQAELAERMDVSRQWVIRAEKGNDAAEFSLIMKAFGLLNIDLMATQSNAIAQSENISLESLYDDLRSVTEGLKKHHSIQRPVSEETHDPVILANRHRPFQEG